MNNICALVVGSSKNSQMDSREIIVWEKKNFLESGRREA